MVISPLFIKWKILEIWYISYDFRLLDLLKQSSLRSEMLSLMFIYLKEFSYEEVFSNH